MSNGAIPDGSSDHDLLVVREDSGRQGTVVTLRMDDAPVNALSADLCRSLIGHLEILADDASRAVVITGTGSMFSAGADLRTVLEGGAAYLAEFLPALSELFSTIFSFPKPVIAAVNGHALAGGCILAAAADFRIMSTGRGKIGLPELKAGVPFPRIAIEVLEYAIGAPATRRLVLSAKPLTPESALAHGLVDELADPAELLDRAQELAEELATTIPVDVYAATKDQLTRVAVDRGRRLGDASAVAELWNRRVADGWTAAYMNALTRR
ncbi:enoyl-CoA hydratase/isomerase family protein [Herbiconiux sp. P16]|uniref:enoyl-CoA hydratase/isomerase family protein n=1 Tax=Herbiconiux wuyangfengii TaxID=3342794 RepID=UPI0035B99F37